MSPYHCPKNILLYGYSTLKTLYFIRILFDSIREYLLLYDQEYNILFRKKVCLYSERDVRLFKEMRPYSYSKENLILNNLPQSQISLHFIILQLSYT
jgi:hypothetical protein